MNSNNHTIFKNHWAEYYNKTLNNLLFNTKDFRYQKLKERIKKNDDLLEVGCGSGIVSFMLAKEFNLQLTLSDISGYVIKNLENINKHIFKNKRIRFVKADVINLPFKDKEFDIVWSSGMLQYVTGQNRRKAFMEIQRVCKIKGYIILSLAYKYDFPINLLLNFRKHKYDLNYETFTNKDIKNLFKNQKIVYLSGWNWLSSYDSLIKELFKIKKNLTKKPIYKIRKLKRNKFSHYLNNKVFLTKLFGPRIIIVQKLK